MIYKFIDNNGSEITVNSLSSLQALVDSDTINKKTKVKAGLRGKWTTADKIDGILFAKEEEMDDNSNVSEEDIKSFITAEKIKEETEPLKEEPREEKKVETKQNQKQEKVEIIEPVEEKIEVNEDEEINNSQDGSTQGEHTTDEEEWSENKEDELRDKTYDDENVIGINFFDAVGICFKKYFNFKDRASRSEYWYFQILVIPISIWSQFPSNTDSVLILQIILLFGIIIPAFSSGVRRLHDRDKSGWWILINFIPFIGWIFLLVMLIEKGTEGDNKFGSYPLRLKKK